MPIILMKGRNYKDNNMNQNNIDNNENENQKEYREYYRGQLINAVISGIYLILIPLLIISPQITAFLMHGELLLPPNIVLLIGGVFSVSVFLYWTKTRLSKVFFYLIAPCYVALFILLVTSALLPIHSYDGLSLYGIMITISIIFGVINFIREFNSWRYAKKVVHYMTPHIPEDHTAVILTHDAKRAMDGGDKPVLKLLENLVKYNENYQIYLCLYEEDMVNVLTNPFVKRIWIFGHGDRGGCCLTGKYFSYEEFMTEKTDNGDKLRDIEPKEYVYQCHCNPKSTTPLTDYLLKEKGLLNPDVDDMPNFLDSGITDMKVEFSLKHFGLFILVWAHKILGYILHMDFNYTNPSSIEYFINRYADHLKKKTDDPQKAYLDYYQGQLDKAKSSIKCPLVIAVLNYVLIALIFILPDQLQYLPNIVLIAGSIFIIYLLYLLIRRINDRIYIVFYISFLLLINLGFFLEVWQYIDVFTAVTITTGTITFATILLYYLCIYSEDDSLKDARNVVQYIKSHKSEDHTAVILKHDANKFMDGGDKNALPLIKVLNKYRENFQIYLCLNEDNMVEVLTNPHVKRIWIFGHGKRGCLRLTDKLFSYENFMKEYDTELRKIGPREYVYQCHCNRGTAKPLTDCLLNKRKGLLDQKVDNMPNFFDTGLADMELDESIESKCRLRIAVSLCSTLGKRLSIDLNYNCPSSVEHIIKRYEAHLEKKSKLADKAIDE